jgi:hypothetical protein
MAASWAEVGSSSEQVMTPETTLCLQPEWPPDKGTQNRTCIPCTQAHLATHTSTTPGPALVLNTHVSCLFAKHEC